MNGITKGFRALAKPLSIIFPSVSLILMVLVLLQFRFYIPEAGVAFAVVFYALSALYLACLFTSRVWLPGLIALLAMPAIVFFIGIMIYWPVIVALLPAIFKAFRERERMLAARIVTFTLTGLLVVTFVPTSILSCKAYSTDTNPAFKFVSPDSRHMLQISVRLEANLGGPGNAVLYERYPLGLERAEKTIFFSDWIGVTRVPGSYSGDVTVDVDAKWADNGSLLINGHAVDVHATPLLFMDTDLVEYAQAAPIAPTLPPTASAAATPAPTPGVFLASGVQQDEWNYRSSELNIHIEKTYKYKTTLYIADVQVLSMENCLTAFSHDAYDRAEERTSVMAKRQDAVLAINGDYHSFRSTGVIIRNGKLYRNKPKEDIGVIYTDGHMDTFGPKEADGEALIAAGAWQTFSFGPALVKEGRMVEKYNVPESIQDRNPRTSFGQVAPNHFIIIVADGRDTGDKGITFENLAKEFIQRGCKTAYNLDGGGSSALYFLGRTVNDPCYGKERPLSDILYFKDR